MGGFSFVILLLCHTIYGFLLACVGGMQMFQPSLVSKSVFSFPLRSAADITVAALCGLTIMSIGTYHIYAAMLMKNPVPFFIIATPCHIIKSFGYIILVYFNSVLPSVFIKVAVMEAVMAVVSSACLMNQNTVLHLGRTTLMWPQLFHSIFVDLVVAILLSFFPHAMVSIVAPEALDETSPMRIAAAVGWTAATGTNLYAMAVLIGSSGVVYEMLPFARMSIWHRFAASALLWVRWGLGMCTVSQASGSLLDVFTATWCCVLLLRERRKKID